MACCTRATTRPACGRTRRRPRSFTSGTTRTEGTKDLRTYMMKSFAATCVLFVFAALRPVAAQEGTRGVTHGQRPAGRLIIRNALVVEGNGTPTTGPFDIVLENGNIVDMVPLDPVAARNGNAKRPEGAAEIDATGKYV